MGVQRSAPGGARWGKARAPRPPPPRREPPRPPSGAPPTTTWGPPLAETERCWGCEVFLSLLSRAGEFLG